MKKIHREELDLPFVVGQIYKTKFATGDTFTITKITVKDGLEIGIWGIYDKCPHLGVCPIGVDRLIRPKKFTGLEFEVTQCPKCKHEFKN